MRSTSLPTGWPSATSCRWEFPNETPSPDRRGGHNTRVASPASAQGVPTFDGSALQQFVAQLEHMAEDLNVQMQQLATMRLELETQLSQLTNLEAQLTSLIEGSGLGELFATVEEFRALRGKLVAPLNTAQSLGER
nr:type IV secretion system protein [Pseudohalocynthiibacter aestuariivivens]